MTFLPISFFCPDRDRVRGYIKLQDTLIESRKKDIEEIQKQINKYEKRKETIDKDFTIKSVDAIRGVLQE